MSHWMYGSRKLSERKDVDPDGKTVGFVYSVVNKETGRIYIGRKNWLVKRGKKHVEDWKSYKGSSGWLKEDIDYVGEQGFEFNIVDVANTMTELKALEAFHILRVMLNHNCACYNRSVVLNLMNWKGRGKD